jgi:hypothetical protein
MDSLILNVEHRKPVQFVTKNPPTAEVDLAPPNILTALDIAPALCYARIHR